MAATPDSTSILGIPLPIVTTLISAVTGFLAGILGHVFQRWLERLGKIECSVENLRLEMINFSLKDDLGQRVEVNSLEEATDLSFSFTCVLRNQKSIDIELREPKIFLKDGWKVVHEVSLESNKITGRQGHFYVYEDIRFIIIPQGQSREVQLRGSLKDPSSYQANKCRLIFDYKARKRVRQTLDLFGTLR